MTNEKSKTLISMPSDREILIIRSFDAPRELVWEMYSKTEHLVHWWGPTGWTLPISEMDFRVDGSWFYCMESPEGEKSCGKSFYEEIEAPVRIVLKDIFVDEAGQPFPRMPEAQNTMVFEEGDGKTTILSTVLYDTKEARDQVIEMGASVGIDQTLDRLEAYLAQIQ